MSLIPSNTTPIPPGGGAGELLGKASDRDFHYAWVPNTATAAYSNVKFIDSPADLPDATAGVRTLADDTAYVVTNFVDLNGDRLENLTGRIGIFGYSSVASKLSSTGLTGPLITVRDSLRVEYIELDAAQIFDADGSGATSPSVIINACTLSGSEVGAIANYLAILLTTTEITAQGLTIDGTVGSFVVETSRFLNTAGSTASVTLPATLTITTRIRIEKTLLSVTAPRVGIDSTGNPIIPDGQFSIFRTNFSGGGTYLSGYTETDVASWFEDNTGITNSTPVGVLSANGNVTATTVTQGVPTKAVIATTPGAPSLSLVNSLFTHSDNRLTYIGGRDIEALVSIVISVNSGNNQDVGNYIAINGTPIAEYEAYSVTLGTGRSQSVNVEGVVPLTFGDYIEYWLEKPDDATAVTVRTLMIRITAARVIPV